MRSQNELTSGIPIALTIAGSDSGGGAGIQADIKTFSALGVFGTSAITAVTAQNTTAITDIHSIPLTTVSAQIKAVLDDFDVGAIKIGMLASAEIMLTVADAIKDFPGPVVLDPVMVAKSGDLLIEQTAIDTLRDKLIPMAQVITPNLPEAATLLGLKPARTAEDAADQGEALLKQGANAVLMKGGGTPREPNALISSSPERHHANSRHRELTLAQPMVRVARSQRPLLLILPGAIPCQTRSAKRMHTCMQPLPKLTS